MFAKNGYTGATTREIAGVTNGLIFYHYTGKKTLFLELAHHLRGAVAGELQSRLNDTGNFYERVESFIEHKLSLYSEHPDVLLPEGALLIECSHTSSPLNRILLKYRVT